MNSLLDARSDGPCLLVVDDEQVHRLFVRRVLGAAGWLIVEAGDGREALALAAKQKPALILMDVQMPVLDGLSAARALRADALLSSIPMLAYTASALEQSDLFDGYIRKPCTPELIVEATHRWKPDGVLDGVTRLQSVFDSDEIAALTARLREQLVEALDHFDDPDITARAHRIAGVSGTLGFPALSDAWRRMSEGDPTASGEARQVARLVIAALDRANRD
jgi:CheY-like chemotaxis protein